ncbi:pyruvate dehydrogenase (acetyl-transferring) kinase isozyme 2, mitochondrial-like isoform X2 [Ruditapes philippinarum]|uniref:pyruvate dehydrogenase (acetyl-transferring) kinase isozyme 2, mitochondrial-like isoform X2 n=1 Tax=Ruditapes philippinarum TaxID=129788 RepID=UPI00295B1E15|nr:pyruvate dehydrogenase (acetyl-transferring) kinase isozyme 2, mitochondrial-like isoform X2 [Ruditapes philippinarum]
MRFGRVLFQRVAELVDHYSQYHPSPLSMKTLVDFGSKTGTEASSFEFLRQELPVRLANIMKEINHLPDNLQQMPSVAMVRNWYQASFTEILEFEDTVKVEDKDKLAKFADVLVKIRNRHSNVVETMAQGVMELKDAYGDSRTDSQIQYFLDRFYTSRISIRMLINQHALLYGDELANHPQHVGCIDPNCDVLEVVRDAYSNARFLCEQYYMISPDLKIESYNPYEKTDSVRLVYVPSHLYHMLFELFKNAMRAVVEVHGDKAEIPPVEIAVCKGKEDLTIKVSDQGGGIAFGKVDLLFQYMYTTAPQPQPSHCREGSAPLAGYGYGLPLSRLYARYFQGDLVLNSMEGHGTDAMIYLKVLSDEANECLPVYNKTASRVYESDTPVSDWSTPTPWTQNPSRSYSTYVLKRTMNPTVNS